MKAVIVFIGTASVDIPDNIKDNTYTAEQYAEEWLNAKLKNLGIDINDIDYLELTE